jgi:succinate dehydrogenase / fumarate reductase membrane anchor subunit
MSTTTRPGTASTDAATQATKRQSRRGAYLMMRLTGVLLAVLVTGHLVVTHVVTDVASTDASFIAKRWGSALWVTWDSLMLAAALAHAGAGVWAALDDYARDPALRRRLRSGLVALTVALLVFGAYVIAKAVYS